MAAALGAIAPVFLLLLLGFLLGRRDFPGPGFWPAAERLVYFVLFPALLVRSAAAIDADGQILAIAAAVLGPIFLVMGLVASFGQRLGLGRRLLPAVAQAATRQNVYIAFAAALGIWGEPALVPLAIAVAAYTPGVNIASALLLGMHAETRLAPLALARALALNPLVLACAVGLALGFGDLAIPPPIDEVLRILAWASLPLALLATGAGLRWRGLGSDVGWLLGTAVFKLAGQPLLTVLVALLLGLDGLALAVVVLFAALPLSPTAYVQTRAMGGHAVFMANAVALQTLAAMATLPVVLILLVAAGE
jgi:malonate transporter and related proteins